jgi:hypothetical protein
VICSRGTIASAVEKRAFIEKIVMCVVDLVLRRDQIARKYYGKLCFSVSVEEADEGYEMALL